MKNIVFDLDGTLLDTSKGIIESVKYTAKTLGYPILSNDFFQCFIGPPIQASFMRYYHCNEEEAQMAANIFRDYYRNSALLKATAYEGIYELCESLRHFGMGMAVATYKREDYALSLLRNFHFDRFFSSMHGADNNNVMKKKDIIDLCLQDLHADTHNTVLVGDTENDAKGAFDAGISFIAVTYGFGFKSKKDVDKYNYIGIANKPFDILNYI